MDLTSAEIRIADPIMANGTTCIENANFFRYMPCTCSILYGIVYNTYYIDIAKQCLLSIMSDNKHTVFGMYLLYKGP